MTGIRRDLQRATIAQTEQEPTAASSATVQPATGPTWAKPVDRVLRSPGQPLDATARQEMEQRFGHDFGEVRVHTGDVAAESARAVQALAYTVGYDVVLGADQGRLGTARRRVLMHELAHVVQYAQGAEVPGTGLTLGDVHDPAERAADAAVDAAERMHVTTADRGTDNGMRGRMGGGTGRLRRQPAPGPAPGPGPGVTPGQISACRIEFQKGSTATVDATALDACLELARAYVAAGGARTVAVHGYASEEGDAAFNTDLAQRRAQRVRQLLVGVGIPDTAILVSGHGADRTYPGLAPNRRAEVVLSESISFPGENVTVAKFTCGPDVTAQVGRAVAHARAIFAGWTPDQRTESCEDLRGVTTGSYAWDIVELHNNAWILGYRPYCATQGATPACGSTVQVGAECYYAGSPNYVIFGTMCRLCYDHFHAERRAGATIGYTGYMDFTESSMLDLIDLYKSSSANVGPSKAWAVAGRDGWPSGGTPPPGDRPGCAPQCSLPYSGPDFRVNWYPHEFHTG